jgi:hypothetical protein
MDLDTQTKVNRKGNRYCGPLVIAAITGKSTAEAAASLRRITGRESAVKKVRHDELIATLSALGFVMRRMTIPRRVADVPMFGRKVRKWIGPTLTEWLRTGRDRQHENSPYIVHVSHHYLLVKGRKMIDTFTDGEWTWLREAPHRRKRVLSAWRIEQREGSR